MAQTPHVPPVTPPPVMAIDTSVPPRRPARRRSKPWGWILGLCGAFAGGMLIGLMIGRGSARLPWTPATVNETPAAITEIRAASAETPEQQDIRAWLDQHLIPRDYEIVGYSEPFDHPRMQSQERDAIRVTLDVTTPAEGTQRFVIPCVRVDVRGKTVLLPLPEGFQEAEEKTLEELFQSGPGGWTGTE